jgi:hypothetical protein
MPRYVEHIVVSVAHDVVICLGRWSWWKFDSKFFDSVFNMNQSVSGVAYKSMRERPRNHPENCV